MTLITSPHTVTPPRITPFDLYHEWLDQLSSLKTRRSYTQGWKCFAVANKMGLQESVEQFLSEGPVHADSMCATYRTWMLNKSAAGNTINLRLKSITCLLNYARHKRLLFWELDLKRACSKPVRDTRGPDEEAIKNLLTTLEGAYSAVGFRNLAIARLLYNPALRGFEVLGLDLEHVDIKHSRISVLGQGRKCREWVTIPPTTKSALELWIEMRPGDIDNPALFVAMDGGHYGHRLSASTIRNILLPFGIWALGLRRSAIKKALDLTDGDIRAVQKFARHASPQQVLAYDDCRRDRGRQISELLDEVTEGDTE